MWMEYWGPIQESGVHWLNSGTDFKLEFALRNCQERAWTICTSKQALDTVAKYNRVVLSSLTEEDFWPRTPKSNRAVRRGKKWGECPVLDILVLGVSAQLQFCSSIQNNLTDKPNANGRHFSYPHVVVFLYDFELDGRVENLGNAKCSDSWVGSQDQLTSRDSSWLWTLRFNERVLVGRGVRLKWQEIKRDDWPWSDHGHDRRDWFMWSEGTLVVLLAGLD